MKNVEIFAIIIALAMILSCLAACDLGGKNNETTSPTTKATPSSDPAVTAAEPDVTTVADITTSVDITTAEVTTSPEATTAPEVTTAPVVTTAPEATTTTPDVTTVPEVTTAPEATTAEIPVVTEPSHTHSFSSEWKSDASNHWKECSCGEKSGLAGHTYGDWTVTKEPTETATGERYHTCTVCGYNETNTIPTLDHVHVFGTEWKSDGTNHWHECSCGEKSETATHNFGSRILTKPETCTSEGEMECVCEICGYKKTEIIEKLPHSPVFVSGTAATCLLPGTADGSKCSVCGTILVAQETVPALGHDYAETVVPPSKTKEGYTRHDCVRCGDSYIDNYVPATGSLGLAYKNNGDGTCTITGIGTCTDEDIIVPGKIDGLTVVGIGDNAFENQTQITTILLPDSITTIGKRAYYNCTGLEETNIPSTVTAIGTQPFFKSGIKSVKYCCGLGFSETTSIFAGTSLTSICFDGVSVPDFVCAYCSSLKNITFNDSVVRICNGAFMGCVGLTQVTFTDGIEDIGINTFYGCTNLETVSFAPSVTVIAGCAFAGCHNLSNINLPAKLSEIGARAFDECQKMGKIVIPNSVKVIGTWAFRGCSGLTEIVLHDDITSLGMEAFYGCVGLTTIVIPDSVSVIGYGCFSECSNLQSIVLPDSICAIEDYAFSGCSSLQSIIIPNGVTSIGNSVFTGCKNLVTITIPNSLTTFGLPLLKNSQITELKLSGTAFQLYDSIYGQSYSVAQPLILQCNYLKTIYTDLTVKKGMICRTIEIYTVT